MGAGVGVVGRDYTTTHKGTHPPTTTHSHPPTPPPTHPSIHVTTSTCNESDNSRLVSAVSLSKSRLVSAVDMSKSRLVSAMSLIKTRFVSAVNLNKSRLISAMWGYSFWRRRDIKHRFGFRLKDLFLKQDGSLSMLV